MGKMDFKLDTRKLTKSGSSIVLTAPKGWLEQNKLKAGDVVIMQYIGKELKFIKVDTEEIDKMKKKLRFI